MTLHCEIHFEDEICADLAIVPHPIDALPNIPPRLSISGHWIRDTVAAVQGNLA